MGNDKESARALAGAVLDARLVLPAQAGSSELCIAYEALFGELHERLGRVIGPRAVMAVIHRAILSTARQHVILEALTATDTGIAFGALRGRRPPAEPFELQRAVSDLLCAALDDLVTLIGPDLLGGILDTADRSAGSQVAAPARAVEIKTIPTGIPNLDPILGGGLPELSVTLVGGLVGTGKTTLAQQIAFQLGTLERPAVYFTTLGEPALKLLRYQQRFGFFDATKVGKALHVVDIGGEAADHGTVGALKEIASHVARLSPRLVVIDSFRALDDQSGGSPARWRLFSHELVELLGAWQCTALLVGEYTEEQVGIGPEFTVADNIVYLSQELHHNSVVRKLRVVKLRGQAPQPGRHAFRVLDRGLEIYPHLPTVLDAPRRAKGARAGTGIPGLDEMMGGGIPRGQTCVVAGSSGVGKTLMSLHFAVAGALAGEPCVMATFEESPAEHAEKMAEFGWDLADLETRGLVRMVYLRPVDLSLDEVMHTLSVAVDEVKARRIVINSISGMETALPQTERAELVEGLYRLSANLTARGLVVMVTVEVPDSFGDIRISGQGLSFLSDNAVLLRYVEIAGEIRRALIIVKMRTSRHESTLREYRIGSEGIVLEESFKDYSGVLSGAPTLRTIPEPRAFTAGLAPNAQAAMNALLSLKHAGAQEVAAAVGAGLDETRHLLERLEATGYVIQTGEDDAPTYRVALLSHPGPAPRRKE